MKAKPSTLLFAALIAGCATAGPKFATGIDEALPLTMTSTGPAAAPVETIELAATGDWSPVLAVGTRPLEPFDMRPTMPARTIQLHQPPGELHVVRPGDTLFAIARDQLGSGGRWREIVDANPQVAASGVVRPGQIVMLP